MKELPKGKNSLFVMLVASLKRNGEKRLRVFQHGAVYLKTDYERLLFMRTTPNVLKSVKEIK